MLKPFSGEKKSSPVEMGPKMAFFFENWEQTLDSGFATQKALLCAEPRRLTYFASKSARASRL